MKHPYPSLSSTLLTTPEPATPASSRCHRRWLPHRCVLPQQAEAISYIRVISGYYVCEYMHCLSDQIDSTKELDIIYIRDQVDHSVWIKAVQE
uniref:Uncharacterized protein n=1 Tax=Oryza barthii TaxID=65489 RepID=A0A0D3FJK7_9ORYZ